MLSTVKVKYGRLQKNTTAPAAILRPLSQQDCETICAIKSTRCSSTQKRLLDYGSLWKQYVHTIVAIQQQSNVS